MAHEDTVHEACFTLLLDIPGPADAVQLAAV